MKGLSQLMRQAQEMQANMQKAQNELAATEVEGVAGGGMVKVVVTRRTSYLQVTTTLTMQRNMAGPQSTQSMESSVVSASADS